MSFYFVDIKKRYIMKRVFFLSTFFLTFSIVSHSQSLDGFGFIAGLNYNANGDYFQSAESTAQHPDRNVGFHVGLFGKIGQRVYFKPALIFTSTKSGYSNGDFKMQKLDAPLLIGIKVIGPISVFGGPAFQYILDNDFEGVSVENFKSDVSAGINFGISLNISKVGIDLKYERGFSKNEANFLNNNNIDLSRIDSRPDQLILSFSLLL